MIDPLKEIFDTIDQACADPASGIDVLEAMQGMSRPARALLGQLLDQDAPVAWRAAWDQRQV